MIIRLTLEMFDQNSRGDKKAMVASIDDQYLKTLEHKEDLIASMIKSLEKDIEEEAPKILRRIFQQ